MDKPSTEEGPLPRGAYAIATICRSELKKLRGFLDKGAHIEIATDEHNGQVYLFSDAKIQRFHLIHGLGGEPDNTRKD